jgi:hypothetical protein
MNLGRLKKIASLTVGIVLMTRLVGCVVAEPGPDHYEHVDVVDVSGYHHTGYYDEHHDWHGGYYDAGHVYHDDPHDWHQ